MGDNQDQAEGMFFQDSKKILEDIAEQSNITFINTGSLIGNTQERLIIYQEEAEGKVIELFVNIGGAFANFGGSVASIVFLNALVLGGLEIPALAERGLILEFLAAGILVVHLLNVRDLAFKNRLLLDPTLLPEIGPSEIYFEHKYQKGIIILTIFIVISFIIYLKKAKIII